MLLVGDGPILEGSAKGNDVFAVIEEGCKLCFCCRRDTAFDDGKKGEDSAIRREGFSIGGEVTVSSKTAYAIASEEVAGVRMYMLSHTTCNISYCCIWMSGNMIKEWMACIYHILCFILYIHCN